MHRFGETSLHSRLVSEVISVPCPGTRENTVYLTNELTTPYGVGHPYNSGECQLFVDALDAGWSVLDELPLEPGEGRDWYYPPDGAVAIVVVCRNDCTGRGELTYDMPNA